MILKEKEFKQQFIINFISNWCAVNYYEYCLFDKHKLLENPPIEDILYLADKIWNNIKNVIN